MSGQLRPVHNIGGAECGDTFWTHWDSFREQTADEEGGVNEELLCVECRQHLSNEIIRTRCSFCNGQVHETCEHSHVRNCPRRPRPPERWLEAKAASSQSEPQQQETGESRVDAANPTARAATARGGLDDPEGLSDQQESDDDGATTHEPEDEQRPPEEDVNEEPAPRATAPAGGNDGSGGGNDGGGGGGGNDGSGSSGCGNDGGSGGGNDGGGGGGNNGDGGGNDGGGPRW